MSPRRSFQPVFRVRIQLREVQTAVWRRLLVPGNVPLPKLHDFFQAAMGWTDSHLHSLTVADVLYGMHFDDWPDEELDEKDFTIAAAIGHARRLTYEYDFGDCWTHDVVVEEQSLQPVTLKFAVCLDGQNACPPEDVGGTSGFARFKEAVADPADEEHDEYLEWLGGNYDPADFDLAAVNAALQRIR